MWSSTHALRALLAVAGAVVILSIGKGTKSTATFCSVRDSVAAVQSSWPRWRADAALVPQADVTITQGTPTNGLLKARFPIEMLSVDVRPDATAATDLRSLIGTSEFDCSTKDPSGANVKAAPTAGFMQLDFEVLAAAHMFIGESLAVVQIEGSFFAPDSLSNSMFVQVDNRTGAILWDVPIRRAMLMSLVTPAAAAAFPGLLERCFLLPEGPHNIRLYVREPGIGAASLTAKAIVARPQITNVSGCGLQGCQWNDRIALSINVSGLCGPSMFHPSSSCSTAGRV